METLKRILDLGATVTVSHLDLITSALNFTLVVFALFAAVVYGYEWLVDKGNDVDVRKTCQGICEVATGTAIVRGFWMPWYWGLDGLAAWLEAHSWITWIGVALCVHGYMLHVRIVLERQFGDQWYRTAFAMATSLLVLGLILPTLIE